MPTSDEDRRISREIEATRPGSDPFAAAMRATRMPMLITDPRQDDNPVVFLNDAFSVLTGYPREEILGRNCRFLQGPDTNRDDLALLRQAILDRRPIELELLNYRKDGSTFWNRLLVSPVFHEGRLTYYFASQMDVSRERLSAVAGSLAETERDLRQRVAALTGSHDRMQVTLKAGGLGTWSLDLARGLLVASDTCKENFGRRPEDSFTYEDLQAAIHPDDRDRWRTAIADALAGNGELFVEYRAILPDASLRTIQVRAETQYDAAHRPQAMAGISMDVTQQREADADRDLQNLEMNHRIKNLLATVQSVVRQSLRSSRPASELQDVISQRIDVLGQAQDLLTGRDLDMTQLGGIVGKAIAPFNAEGRIVPSGPPLDVAIRTGTALAMALHELGTNAVKYGALSNDAGRVRIDWTLEEGRLDLTWTEQGGPPVAPPTRTGFGTVLIERMLAATLGGQARIDYPATGLVFRLQSPLPPT